MVTIHPFKNEYSSSFKSLNLEWIEEFFSVEEEDNKILSNPKKYVLDKGGEIFFAKHNEKIVGTSAIIPSGRRNFELAKMAVTKSIQGQGVGRMLIDVSIQFAKDKGADEVFLITNDTLIPALKLYKSSGFDIDQNYDDNRYARGNTKLKLKVNERRMG
jgi:GNAT superfamily N-acetyltransferase